MEPYLLAGLVLVSLVYAVLTARQNKRHLGVVTVMTGAHMKELADLRTELGLVHIAYREQITKTFDAHREDVAQLCQRIQAPEMAVVEHQQRGAQEPSSYPLTDEQLAQQQELAAFVERIEQVENENAGILS